MRIYIPSYGRAGDVLTHQLFKGEDYKIVIPEKQYADYRDCYDDRELLVVPDNRDGNVAKKRNAILDIMKSEEGYGILVDDDIKNVIKLVNKEELSGKQILNIFNELFIMSNDLGAKYCGLANNDQPIRYVGGYCPFSLTKIFYYMVGVIEDGLRYDENLKAGEDADFYFKQVHKNKLVVRDNRYFATRFDNNKGSGVGIKDADRGAWLQDVQKRWGSKVMELNPDGTLKAVRQARKGI